MVHRRVAPIFAAATAALWAAGGHAVSLVEHLHGPDHLQLDDGFPYTPVVHVPPTEKTFAQAYFLTEAAAQDNARCLDGTVPVYYHRKGTGDGANKWFLWQEGGAWCTSDASCAERALGALGSTKDDPQNRSLDGGYFAVDPKVNPLMYNWNAVYLRYCDGASVSGDVAAPVAVGNQTLHYRGKAILDAEIASLLDGRSMRLATDVVVGGCSAGGLATYLHCDRWADAISVATGGRAKTRCAPDSGFFIDSLRKCHGRLTGAYRTQSCAAGVHPECIAAHNVTGDGWKCFFAQWTAPFIKTPTFGLQSQYDSWQGGGNNVSQFGTMGQDITALVTSQLLTPTGAARGANGAFLDSCSHHCGSSGPQPAWGGGRYGPGSRIDGASMGAALKAWYEQGSLKLQNHGFYNADKPYSCGAGGTGPCCDYNATARRH